MDDLIKMELCEIAEVPVEEKPSLVMSDGTLMCPSCDYTFKTNLQLTTHIGKKHKKGKMACSFNDCDKTSNFRCDLKKHMRVHLGTTKTCFRCGKIFQSASGRRFHEKKSACESILKDPLNTELNYVRIYKDKEKGKGKDKHNNQFKDKDPISRYEVNEINREEDLETTVKLSVISGDNLKNENDNVLKKEQSSQKCEGDPVKMNQTETGIIELIQSLSKRGVVAFPKADKTIPKEDKIFPKADKMSANEPKKDNFSNNVLEENCEEDVKADIKDEIKEEYMVGLETDRHIFYNNGNPIGMCKWKSNKRYLKLDILLKVLMHFSVDSIQSYLCSSMKNYLQVYFATNADVMCTLTT